MQWVATKLLSGDVLGGSDKGHSLSDLYGVSAKDIVEQNGVQWNKKAIDVWVLSTGGKRLPYVASDPFDADKKLGWSVFTDDSVILLPDVEGIRERVAAPAPDVLRAGLSAKGWLAISLVILAGLRAWAGGGKD